MGKIDFSIGQPEPVPEEKTILVDVKGRHASAVYRDIITSGSRGIYATFTFDAVWDDLTKIAVFEGSERKIDVELTGESCEVPPEVMEMPTSYLRIGVYGVDGTGGTVIPTVYASVRRIEQGTDPSGEHPAEKTKTLVEKLMEAAQAARKAADEAERLAQSVRDDADAGEFDGKDGNGIWWTVSRITSTGVPGYGEIRASYLKGRSGTPAAHDLVIGPAIGDSGSIAELYEISSVATGTCALKDIGSLKGAPGAPGAPGDPGADGYAPEVTIEQIDGGYRVTITSADYPEGQSFDVMNGQGGGGGITVDDEISATSENPVQNKVIKAALDGKGTYSKPSGGIPASDLAEDAQRGYTVEETRTVIIPEQTVTTESDGNDAPTAGLTLASGVTAPEAGDTLSVTINGETKEIVGQSAEGSGQVYFVFSGDLETPFDTGLIGLAMIDPSGGPSYLVTIGISPATYTISAELVTRTMTVSPEFQEARGYVVDDAAKGEVILAEATYSEWDEVDDTPPYWNASYSSGAPDPETNPFPDAVIITFDGVPYKVPRTPAEPAMASYGCLDDSQFPDFPQFFPVAISFWAGGFELFVQTAGEHTISVNAAKTEVTTTPDFAAAVAKSSAEALAEKLDTDGDAYRAASIPMGELESTSTATAMTATVPGITELRDGVCVWLKNGVITSASGVTLNINSLGAKPIYNSLSGAIVTTTFAEASTYLFVYNSTRVNGGCWDMVYGYDTNTTYTPPKLGFGYGVCSTAAATVAKVVSISNYTLVPGGIVAIKFNEDVPAGASLNINSKGAKVIFHKGAAITRGVIKAGDTVTMIYSTYYHVLSIDRDMDTLPPSPSNNDPVDISTVANAGSSTDYARADHMHRLDVVVFENILDGVLAVNVPVILYDGDNNGVVIQQTPQCLASAYQHQSKMNFALVVPPDYNNYPVLFTVSKFDTTTGELHLTGIVGGVLYEATLLPGLNPIDNDGIAMVGTLTQTNLALPSAQGVSF